MADVLTLLTKEEIRQIFREEIKAFFDDHRSAPMQPSAPAPVDRIGGVELAREITKLTASSIYAKTSRREIPHSKRDGKLTFVESELRRWMTENKRATKSELAARAASM